MAFESSVVLSSHFFGQLYTNCILKNSFQLQLLWVPMLMVHQRQRVGGRSGWSGVGARGLGLPFCSLCVGRQVGGELICKQEKELDQISEVFLSLSSAW